MYKLLGRNPARNRSNSHSLQMPDLAVPHGTNNVAEIVSFEFVLGDQEDGVRPVRAERVPVEADGL